MNPTVTLCPHCGAEQKVNQAALAAWETLRAATNRRIECEIALANAIGALESAKDEEFLAERDVGTHRLRAMP